MVVSPKKEPTTAKCTIAGSNVYCFSLWTLPDRFPFHWKDTLRDQRPVLQSDVASTNIRAGVESNGRHAVSSRKNDLNLMLLINAGLARVSYRSA